MSKHVSKYYQQIKDEHKPKLDAKDFQINAVKQKKDVVIQTIYGDVLVTAGNYVVTMPDGTKVGMTQQDIDANYESI